MCSCECFLAALNQPALLHLEVTTEQLLGASWYIPAAVTPPGMAAGPYLPGVPSSRAGVSSLK